MKNNWINKILELVSHREKLLIVAIFLLFGIAFIIVAHYYYPGIPIGNIWINLAAGSFMVIFTIFGVDYLRERAERVRWKDAKSIAKQDLHSLSNMLIVYISEVFGISATDFNIDMENLAVSSTKIIDHIVSDLLQKDLVRIFNNMSVSDWQRFEINLRFIKNSLAENIQVYSVTIPPMILGKLLIIRQSFNRLFDSYSIVPDLFNREESKWPINKNGIGYNRRLRQEFIGIFSRDLKNYLIVVKEYRQLLKGWENEK